jgi:3-oxoacyl-[acyl-carrier protein] reductase
MQGMKQPLQGKRAVVTGGTRGIGRAVVEALLAEGVTVTLCGRTEESTAAALAELGEARVYGRAADVSQEAQVAALFEYAMERMGGIDILVASAGVGIFGAAGDLSIVDWHKTVGINLTGVFLCSQAAIQRMRGAGGGFIVHLSSLAGRNPFAGGAA